MSIYAMIYTKQGGQELPSQLDPRGEGLLYGHALALAWDEVNQIAKEIGVPSLARFYYDESEAYYDSEVCEQAGVAPPAVKEWHNPREGLQSVVALLGFFQSRKVHVSSPVNLSAEECSAIIWDLSAYRLVLECALKEHQPFHIEIY